MIFLNPAVLLGLIAASIPVIIHLLNLRKLKKIEFSTLSFLKELQKNKIRKIKIKQWFLLALRIAIILLLVLAFARPTLEGVAIGGTTSAAKTSAVFILDDTYSMSVVDGNGSYFNQAKSVLKEILNQFQEGDDAALLLVSEKNEELQLSNNLSQIIKQIDEAEISSASGTLHNSIIEAGNLLAGSNNFNKEIYIVSDFQKNRLAEENSFTDLGELMNEKIKLYTINYSGKNAFNISIDEIKINTKIFQKDKPVSVSVTVTNHSSRDWNDGVVSLFVNGERSAQQSAVIPAGESAVLNLETAVKTTGKIELYVEIEDDDIIADNKRYIILNIPAEIPVMIFGERNSDYNFLKLALSAVDENESTLKISNKGTNQFASVNLAQYDVIILTGAENISNPDRLKNFIINGGGVFIIPGENTNADNFNKLMNALELPAAAGESGSADETENAIAFQQTEINHPVFQEIFSKQEVKKIESPDIYKHLRITPGGTGLSIISLMDNSSFLTEYKSGKGKICVLNTAAVLSWSNFPLKSIFAPLMNKSVYYLASKDVQQEEYTVGSDININLSSASLPQVKIVKPDNTEEFVNLSREQNYISFSSTSQTGIYTVYSGENLVDNFSVNTDQRESTTDYLTEIEFEEYLNKINFKGNYISINRNENPAEIIMHARFGSELWKLFLIAALILAVVEMAVARNAKKDLNEI